MLIIFDNIDENFTYLKKGKSLSLICGSLKWLKDFKENQQKELEKLKAEEEEEKKKSL